MIREKQKKIEYFYKQENVKKITENIAKKITSHRTLHEKEIILYPKETLANKGLQSESFKRQQTC